MSTERATTCTVTLPDGTTVEAIEVEVETRFEGPSYLGTDVPYVVPVDWRNGTDDINPRTVRLFMVAQDSGRGPTMPDLTATHTHTVEHFADPFKRCRVCGAWVDGYIVAPYYSEDGENWPCRHRGYDDLCPSWSPVDGCRCAEQFGFVDHPVRGSGNGRDEAQS